MPIINNPKAPWIYVEEEGGGNDSRDTAGLRHRSSQSCDSTHKTAQVQVRQNPSMRRVIDTCWGKQLSPVVCHWPDARAGHVQELANMKQTPCLCMCVFCFNIFFSSPKDWLDFHFFSCFCVKRQ